MTNPHDFYITYIRCDTPMIETREVAIEEQNAPKSVSEYQARVDNTIPEKRILILSIWDVCVIDKIYKSGSPLPNEVYIYLNGAEDYPEPPTPPPFNNGDNYEDGDDWKQLLH